MPASSSAIVRLIGAYQVVAGALGGVLVLTSVTTWPRSIAYGSQTGQLGIVLANALIALAFLSFFGLALVGGANAWRLRPGRSARLVPILLIAQAPVLAAPGFQFFIALVPPQIGLMILPGGTVRLGLLFELNAQFNLAFEPEVVSQAIMFNVVPLALLTIAILGARDSVLFPQPGAPAEK
jgi:hypothetical protein